MPRRPRDSTRPRRLPHARSVRRTSLSDSGRSIREGVLDIFRAYDQDRTDSTLRLLTYCYASSPRTVNGTRSPAGHLVINHQPPSWSRPAGREHRRVDRDGEMGGAGLGRGKRSTSNSLERDRLLLVLLGLSTTCAPSASSSSTVNVCSVFDWSHGTWIRSAMPKDAGSGPVYDPPPPKQHSLPCCPRRPRSIPRALRGLHGESQIASGPLA